MKMFESVWKESPDPAPLLLRKGSHVRSAAVIHQGALGDFLLALPAFETLRNYFPRARMTFIGYPRILELAVGRFYAEEMIAVDRKEMASFFLPGGPLDPTLSQIFRRFDLIVVFGKNPEGPFMQNLKRVSLAEILHFQSLPGEEGNVHAVDDLLQQLSGNGFYAANSIPKLFLTKSDREWGAEFLRRAGLRPEERSKIVLLHPGSGSRKKVWPLERWSTLARLLKGRYGSAMLIVIGPAEGTEVEQAFQGMHWARGLSILQLASVMKGCGLFIGNDSGVSHLAAALEVPTLAIFGPTDPGVWSPRGRNVCILRSTTACSPCSPESMRRCKNLECLNDIDMEEVLERVESMGLEVSPSPGKEEPTWKRRRWVR
jgi:ADP-heptose:LPS heptosyltransferase